METDTDITWDWNALGGQETTAQEALDNPAAVNAAISSLLTGAQDEPELPDPASDHVRLPGGLWREGKLLRQARVRELTGEDEEKLMAVRGSLVHWVSVLLERAVVSVGELTATPELTRELLIGDRDALLLAVRVATFGPDITAHEVQCPHCERYFTATVDLSTVTTVRLDDPQPDHEYTVELRRGGKARVALPDGNAQEALFTDSDDEKEMSIAHRNTILLGRCVKRVGTDEATYMAEEGEALARALGMADRQKILSFIAETQPGPQLDSIRFLHTDCGEEVRLPLTLPELFRGE